MMIMLYTNATIKPVIVKYLNINKAKNGTKDKTRNQLRKDNQFFLSLNTFSLEKNSFTILPLEGFARLPSSSVQPYEGGSSTEFKKAIKFWEISLNVEELESNYLVHNVSEIYHLIVIF